MVRRWTPQRFVTMRRVRIIISMFTVVAVAAVAFAFTARKTVAITVNGETTTVTTYAMSVDRLLASQGITVKTHDLVESSAGGNKLTDHAVVTVQSAYQTTINIDGQQVPFWTTATSVAQLLGFFEANEVKAAKVTVDIDNVYNKLTGGLVINTDGPVTVIADGKSSVAPNGKLPAASILDSKGITLGKEDRVSVENSNGETILRVQRVTHGQETRTVTVAHGTQTVVDSSLAPGETKIIQQGEDGEKQQVYDVTYVDGAIESETLVSETTTKIALDTIIAVGPSQAGDSSNGSGTGQSGTTGGGTTGSSGNGTSGSGSDTGTGSGTGNDGNDNAIGDNGGSSSDGTDGTDGTPDNDTSHDGTGSDNTGSDNTGNNGDTGDDSNTGDTGDTSTGSGDDSSTGGADTGDGSSGDGNTGNDNGNTGTGSDNSGGDTSDDGSSAARLWHPTVAQAQAYAAGAAAQRGWTGNEWDCLVKLWTRESSWLWYAENKGSGAYGIPQALPPSKMAAFGADWRNDGAVQIDWGLSYIAQRYGSPSAAWQYFQTIGWY